MRFGSTLDAWKRLYCRLTPVSPKHRHISPTRPAATLLAMFGLIGLTGTIPAQVPHQKDFIIWGQALGPDSKGMEALVHAFAAQYPQYNVRLLSLGSGGMDPQKLMTSIVGNVAPDLVYQDRFTVGDWASRGAFLPLDDYLKRDKDDPTCPKPSDYYAAVWNEGMFDGHVYGIPDGADDRILYYNKKIFADNADKLKAAGCDPNRPPRTWSELLAYSKALTEYNPDGTIKRAGFLPNFGNSWLYLYSFQTNGAFLSPDGKKCTFDTPANREALDFMVKGYDQYQLPGETAPGYEKANTFKSGFLANENDPFLVGKVAMKIDGDWILQDLIKYAPGLDLGNGPAPVPDDRYNHTGEFKDEKETYITWTGGFCYSIPKGARNAEAGWDFIKFALNTKGRLILHQGNLDWAKDSGRSYIPRMAASISGNAAIYQKFAPPDPKFANALKIHMDMLKHSRVRPPTFVAQLLWDQQVKLTEDACMHKESIPTALQTAQSVVQRDLDEFYNQDQYPVINLWIPFLAFFGLLLALLAWGIVAFRKKRLGPLGKSEARWGYLFISPWMLGFIVLMLGPMLASLFFSFTYYNVLTPARWDGLKNYHDMFTTDWGETWKAFSNVGYLALVGVPLNIFTGLSIALLLNAGVKGIRFYRTIFYLPAVVPTIASAVLWLWILYGDPNRGLLNGFWEHTITQWLGLAPPGWISSEAWAKPALIVMGAWGAGSGMVLWLAGLKGIPTPLYEASSIDGATPRQQFWSVTLPQLSPVLFFNVVMGFIGALQEFDRVYVMAPTGSDNGAMGPGESLLVPVYKLFHEGFAYFKMGSASALAWAIFIIIMLITGFQFYLSKSWVHYEVEKLSGQLLYLLGTVANWTGWIALAFAVYRGVDVLMKPAGLARGPGVKQFVASAAACAIGFLIANTVPMDSGIKAEGVKLPIVWPVLPFAAWAAVVLIILAVVRGCQLLVDRPTEVTRGISAVMAMRRARMRQAIGCLVLAVAFYWFFKKSGDTAIIVKGVIPFSLKTALAIVLLAIVALILMAVAAQSTRRRGLAKQVVLHVVLLIGCVVFGIPFLWLVITSFKEPLDMSSANGIVWVPKVSETVPYRDPKFPYYEGKMNGVTVQADVIERLPDGKLRLNVAHPMSMQGATFVAAPGEIKEIDRQVPVDTGTYQGRAITGEQIKTTDTGQYEMLITDPPDLKGKTYIANPSEVQPVRHPGLRFANYPDSLDYLPVEANKGLVYLQNTLIIVFFNVIGTLLSSAIVAYGFSRLRFPGRNLFFGILVATMMLPAAVTLLPTFLIFRSLGMIDTLYPLWLPAFFASAFNVFLLRQFFMTIPKELEDASKIDGCNYFKTFWKIMMPQVKPALAVVAIFSFMGVWNNFQGPLVYINSPEHMPISYALQLYNGDHNTEPGLLMAFTVMTMMPVLALFFFAQRYFIEGVTLSGLGGR